MEKLCICIQISDDDSKSEILNLLLETIKDMNDKGYAVTAAYVDERQVFESSVGLSKEFFDKVD